MGSSESIPDQSGRHSKKNAWKALKHLTRAIEKERIMIIDGGTATGVEKLGGKLSSNGWSCRLQCTHPDLLQQVHEQYIHAGADIIIANTYATNSNVLSYIGRETETEMTILKAIQLAQQAKDKVNKPDKRPWIVASISTHPPNMGGERNLEDFGNYLPEKQSLVAYIEAANIITQSNADLLWLEMINDFKHGFKAIQAAKQTGWPFFLGISTRTSDDGKPYFRNFMLPINKRLIFNTDNLNKLIEECGENLRGINIMHTGVNAISATLQVIKDHGWNGILGVYPEYGEVIFSDNHKTQWQAPRLEFKLLLPQITQWIEHNQVSMIGGCCGFGPDYIQALHSMKKNYR